LGRGDASGASEQPLELAVGPVLGGDEAKRAVGQPIRTAYVRHRLPERRLDESYEIGDRAVGDWRLLLGVKQRDRREVGGALGHRLERLALEGRP
jgi:hypothetical protein